MKKLLMTFLMTALLSIVTIAGNERTRAGYSENTQDFVTDTLPNGFYYLDYFHCDMFVDRLAFNILSKEERTVELTSLCAAEMWSDRWIYRMDTMNIPEKVTWNDTVYTVKAIGPWAFCYSEIKHLVIPSTVTEIKDHAFSFIENLEKLVIPNSVTIIGDNAFAGTQMNENVGWPKHVVFPDDMMTLGTGLFAWGKYGSDNLMAIFPRNMKIIPENTYYRGYISEWRDLPESVEVIDKNAFYGNMFKIIHLPPLLREIRDGAFERCNDLKNVTIPASVEYIGQKAFSGGDDYWYSSTRNECTLDTLHMLSEIPCNSMLELTKTVLIVPDGTKEAYRQAWNLAETPIYEESELTGIKNEETGVQDVRQSTHSKSIYNLAGQKVDASYKGIVIQNGKKRILR